MASRAIHGVILKRRDLNEFDRLFTIFTAEEGMVECLARGVRKISSKLGSKLQLFLLLRLQLAQNRGRWPTITGVDVISDSGTGSAATTNTTDFRRFALLCALAELAYLGHRGQTADYDNAADFTQFQEALALLQAGGDLPALLSYAGRLLAELGYLALPLQCARCGHGDQPLTYFTSGVLTCRGCGGQQPIAGSTTATLAKLLTAAPEAVIQIELADPAALAEVMKQLFEYHLDCRLKAWPLLMTLPAAEKRAAK